MGRIKTVCLVELSSADADAYDRFVATAQGGHYSQTRDWAKVLVAGKPFAPTFFLARREENVVGAGLLLRTQIGGLVNLPVAQMERGPVCDDPEDLPDVLRALRSHVHRRGIVRLSVMPYWTDAAKPRVEEILRNNGFRDRQTFNGRHARTLRLDLTALDAEEPFASASLAKVRREVRRAERAGVSTRVGGREDVPAFRRMHEELLRLGGKPMPPVGWYDALAAYFVAGRGAMFVCEHGGRTVSAIFVTCHGGVATYIMGASIGEALRFPKMVLPLAAAIVWAKRKGAAVFDFGGIPMIGDLDAKRASIAEFKYSFSHDAIALVHEHVRWF
jgi:lipid II:glycine glycyltransferase (peptidoglycan interpeptide bridge formation enzyme)